MQTIVYTSNAVQAGGYTLVPQSFTGTFALDTSVTPLISTTFTMNDFSLTLTQVTIPTTGDTESLSSFTNVDSSCPADSGYIETDQYMLYQSSATSKYEYVAGVSGYTHSQTWFAIQKICGTTTASILYSISLSDGVTPCPSWVTINQNTGDLSITVASSAGTLNILVIGTAPNGQKVKKAFQLIATSNFAPYLAIKPQDITVLHKTTTIITNFKAIDPDNDAITFSIFEVGTNPESLPPFITYDATMWTLQIAPTDSTEVKAYHLMTRMVTTYHTVVLYFDVTVSIPVTTSVANLVTALSNLAPPMFDEDLPEIAITAEKAEMFSIPPISDLDNDQYVVNAQLGEASTFTIFKGIQKIYKL